MQENHTVFPLVVRRIFFRSRTESFDEDDLGISVAYSNLMNSFCFRLKLLASLCFKQTFLILLSGID
jgi:hypothetical protein